MMMNPELEWPCAACKEPIANGAGYIHVVRADIRAFEAWWLAELDRRREQDGVVLIPASRAEPYPAQWRVHHRNCDPNPEGNDYWVDVARIRTQAHLISWTAHLLGKTWLQFTDWGHFLEDAMFHNDCWVDA